MRTILTLGNIHTLMNRTLKLIGCVLTILMSWLPFNTQAQTHCKIRYLYNGTGDRIQRDWYCWTPGENEDKDYSEEEDTSEGLLEEVHLTVVPNPADQELYASVPETFAKGTLEVITTTGSIVASGRITGTRTVLNVASIPAGLYFVRLKQGQESILTQISIQH